MTPSAPHVLARRHRLMRQRAAVATGLLVLLGSACMQGPGLQAQGPPGAPKAQAAPPSSPAPSAKSIAGDTSPQLASARADITDSLSLACSSSADCASWGIGYRACGGPQAYLAYAPGSTDRARLLAATRRFEALRKLQIEASGELSTCDLLPQPAAVCSPAGQCELVVSRGGAPGAQAR